MFKRLYSAAARTVNVVPPPPLPAATISPNTQLALFPSHTCDAQSHLKNRPTNWRERPHITKERLPAGRNDIRGVAVEAYKHLYRKSAFDKLATIARNRFFMVKFLPSNHKLAAFRKSNIAYTFTTYGALILNDAHLEGLFTKYKGKFRTLPFFRTKPHPMETACSRSHFRRAIRHYLHEALHSIVPEKASEIAKVSGIYCFRLYFVPTTQEEIQALKAELYLVVRKVYKDESFSRAVQKSTADQNRLLNVHGLERSVTRENHLASENLKGYFPKLPYLGGRYEKE